MFVYFMVMLISKFCIAENEILFENYCIHGNSPDPFPIEGKSSSNMLLMNSPNTKGAAYQPGLNCSVTLQAKKGYQLFLTFSSISLRNYTMDNLTVISINQNASSLSGQQECTNENCTTLKFESGVGSSSISLRFRSANMSIPEGMTGFAAIFTVFDNANPLTGECNNENLFTCKNKHCVWNGLVCDGHNNCGDLSDELSCGNSLVNTIWGIVVVVLGVVSMILFVPVFCFWAIRGTRNQITSITVPAQPTPLYPTLNDGETGNLLSSSEVPVYFGSEEIPHNHKNSINYGTLLYGDTTPSTSKDEGNKYKPLNAEEI